MSEELREAVARWLSGKVDRPFMWDRSGDDYRAGWLAEADEFLADDGPVGDLLAKVRAVEALVLEFGGDLAGVDSNDLDEPYMWHQSALSLHGELARALWGPTP